MLVISAYVDIKKLAKSFYVVKKMEVMNSF